MLQDSKAETAGDPSESHDAQLVSDWTIRPAVAEDEGCIASMWLRQLCHGQDAKAAGFKAARESGSPEQIAYWEQHQPIVTALIRAADVMVACDPERSEYEPGRLAVIWAWAVVHEDIVFGYGIKRSIVQASRETATDLTTEVLGVHLGRPMRTVMDLVDLSAMKMIPDAWRRERGWAASLRQLSDRVVRGDAMYQAVAGFVLDPTRERWLPSSKRAA